MLESALVALVLVGTADGGTQGTLALPTVVFNGGSAMGFELSMSTARVDSQVVLEGRLPPGAHARSTSPLSCSVGESFGWRLEVAPTGGGESELFYGHEIPCRANSTLWVVVLPDEESLGQRKVGAVWFPVPKSGPPEAEVLTWTVFCKVNRFDDKRVCGMAGMRVMTNAAPTILRNSGPEVVLSAASQQNLGMIVFVGDAKSDAMKLRVDKNKAIALTGPNRLAQSNLKQVQQTSKQALAELAKGKSALVGWTDFPDVTRIADISLHGFSEAYAEFQRQLGKTGDSQWVSPWPVPAVKADTPPGTDVPPDGGP